MTQRIHFLRKSEMYSRSSLDYRARLKRVLSGRQVLIEKIAISSQSSRVHLRHGDDIEMSEKLLYPKKSIEEEAVDSGSS